MAKKSDVITYNLDLPLKSEQASALLEMAVENPDATTDAQKIGGIALQLLRDQADGGLMIRPGEMQRITEATGVDPECGEDLVQVLSGATGVEEGKHRVAVLIDPSYYPAYQEIAAIQERPVEALFQEAIDAALEQEWVYQLKPEQAPARILMPPSIKEELEQLLDGKFSTGTELAALVKKAIGGDGLFGEDAAESNVGHEGQGA